MIDIIYSKMIDDRSNDRREYHMGRSCTHRKKTRKESRVVIKQNTYLTMNPLKLFVFHISTRT